MPFKYLQTLARMSFTEYTRHMYIFPKGVRVRVDLPRFPEFFTRSRRAYRNYQNREKYEGKRKRSIYIFLTNQRIVVWRMHKGISMRDRRRE